ncbi:MAG TPA: hypothetical protein VFO86_13990 [Terriglobia bacterium]|nr:hypothetical protein [Terriglobia bacterium]
MTLSKLVVTLSVVTVWMAFSSVDLFAQSSPGTWSANFGPNAKNYGFAAVTKDFPKLNDHVSLFATAGLTTTVLGGGAAYYVTSFHKSSFVFSSTIGIVGAHADAAYQWKVSKRGFLTTGVSYGAYFMQYEGFLPVLSYEIRF